MNMRLIHVGLGGWGLDWSRNVLSKTKDVEIAAWVEIDPEALAQAQKNLDLPAERCFTSLEHAFSTVEAEAVLITTSLPGHVPVAIAALNAGKHVLLEKPFAPSVAEAQQVVDLAAQRECVLMVSQNYRYFPAPQKATALLRDGQLGTVSSVNIDFRKYDNSAPRETHRHYYITEPLLLDMAIHHFDLMRMVLQQEPRKVFCTTWNPTWSNFKEPPAGALTVIFDKGTVVNYSGSWISAGKPTLWAGEWHMECTQGEIAWTSRGEEPDRLVMHQLQETPQEVELPGISLTDRDGSLAAFVEAVRTGKEPATSGRNNLPTLALMFAAIESARTGEPVYLA
ncbi:oxidoreductase [Ktedonobacteria bacterium brp13]|nr:oxidoreductase [Ktedonobacteria bacterium brp13]